MNDLSNITVKISGHEVYKAIRNFLINEQNISRKYIEEEIEKRLNQIIGQHIEQQFKASNIISMIKGAIADYFKKGVPPTERSRYLLSDNEKFDKWLQEQIRDIIRQEVLSQYSITLGSNAKLFDVERKTNE